MGRGQKEVWAMNFVWRFGIRAPADSSNDVRGRWPLVGCLGQLSGITVGQLNPITGSCGGPKWNCRSSQSGRAGQPALVAIHVFTSKFPFVSPPPHTARPTQGGYLVANSWDLSPKHTAQPIVPWHCKGTSCFGPPIKCATGEASTAP
jgi:hypothetical protein